MYFHLHVKKNVVVNLSDKSIQPLLQFQIEQISNLIYTECTKEIHFSKLTSDTNTKQCVNLMPFEIVK